MRLLLFTVGASAPLLLGALIGAWWSPPRQVLAALLALASGAMFTSVAFELFEPAYADGGAVRASVGFLAGALAFVVVDTALDRVVVGGASSFSLLAAVTLDGIPENVALGVGLVVGGSPALLAAVALSNLPEALSGSVALREQGRGRGFVVGVWGGAALLLAAAVLVGRFAFSGVSTENLSIALAFAAGAVLAAVVDSTAPMSFRDGGPWVAMATAIGFLLGFVLSESAG